MIMNKQRQIQVYAHWAGLSEPYLMGILYATQARGNEIFAFEYDAAWLDSFDAQSLDPSLQLFHGHQYAPDRQDNFGIFLDSSPDRWGRFLMNRREAQLARDEDREEQKLLEADYLLGVYDQHRIGALRFKREADGPFLDNNENYAAPPWASLREIEYASLALEEVDSNKDPNYKKWLRMLVAPGGSLGGARPKASVLDDAQHPWIAKFPSQGDDYNVGAWEMLAYELAIQAKINMPQAKHMRFNSRHHTFLSKRFDRTDAGERVHFASAMTLLQLTDGDDASIGASYLELAQFIVQQGMRPTEDLEQLWRRIVFYICISNVDDHLRNHGFIFHPGSGWSLSPAFDINPVAAGDGLKLNISETDNAQDLDLARSVIPFFRLDEDKAERIIAEVTEVVRGWSNLANNLGISSSEQAQLARAFRVADSK
jgi:serine/threonine-protein kinase HipA